VFPRLKIKLKGRHFDTIKEIEAESQAVLNALAERISQNEFNKCQKRRKWCKGTEWDYFGGDGGQWAQSQFLTRWQHQSQRLWMAVCTVF
jgi:hypothetical protein